MQPIQPVIDEKKLLAHLEEYRAMALEEGAADCVIIEKDKLIIDPRAQLKCSQPKCPLFNTNKNCPPHAPSYQQTKEFVDRYRFGLLLKYHIQPDQCKPYPSEYARRMLELLAKIENRAFNDGYYFAAAFGAGSCKATLCRKQPCQALEPGRRCRHPLLARSSMEAVGFDVFNMAAAVGWEIYPLGMNYPEDEISYVSWVGLLLVA